MSKTITKKILPQYMNEIISGRKTFEIRKDEDDIQVGDILVLEEWENGKRKNITATTEVTYVLRDCPEYGLMPGYCIVGIACIANRIFAEGKLEGIREYASRLKSRTYMENNLIDDIRDEMEREVYE